MINGIAELGQYQLRNNPALTAFDIWLEDSYDNKKYPHLLLIEFKKEFKEDPPGWIFHKVEYRENSSALKSSLLYKRGSSRGSDKTPTCKIAKSIKGTLQQKVINWFESNCNKSFLSDEQQAFLKGIGEELNSKKEEILELMEEKTKLLDKKEGVAISVVFLEDNQQKFIGDYDFFSKFITEESKESYKYSKTFKKFSFSENKTCSVCNSQRDEVFGFFTSLAFYTVDKQGMVTGGFEQDKCWKNYPVCLDCALNIEMGTQLIEKRLLFNFYGLRYYLIPKLIHQQGQDDIISDIFDFLKSPRFKDSDSERIMGEEGDVLSALKEEKNNIALDLLFFEKPQKGVFRITSLIQNVLPSRLKQLYEAKAKVENLLIFKDQLSKEGKELFRFNFGVLREFFPTSKIEGNNDKYFLELTQKIFSGSKIDYQFIIHHIVHQIRRRFVQNQPFSYQTKRGFLLLLFLSELELFGNKSKRSKMNIKFLNSFVIDSKDQMEEKVGEFFDAFSDFFYEKEHISNSRCTIFLIGVLTQFLLNFQQHDRKATPFRNRLKGLKMDARDIVTLLPSINDKFAQYDKSYVYNSLDKLIAGYAMSAGKYQDWNLPIDEMNTIFLFGMNLSQYFKINKKEE